MRCSLCRGARNVPGAALAALVVCGLALPGAARAQLIPVKTVPIASGDQFDLFPSRNAGMAGVSIALDDPLLDPFTNPGKGRRVSETRLFVSPSVYTVSDGMGVGRSLPVGATFRGGEWFGGLMLSLQELEGPEPPVFIFLDPFPSTPGASVLSEETRGNVYTFAMLGRDLPGTEMSLGGSVFWASLNGLEGVDVLFPNAARLNQSGDVVDVRVGLSGDLPGERTFEAVLVHNRLDMTYDIIEWLPGPFEPVAVPSAELDRTNTWGVHLGYVAPLEAESWRLGGILTANYKDHPKIPNYELASIPRDPGHTWAFDVGVGISRTLDRTRFGIDLVLEPIWSDTWAEAAIPTPIVGGGVIPVGGHTVENEFRFTNALMRMGVGYETTEVGFELGLQVRSIDYTLEQVDLVNGTTRRQDESWKEWTPTWGLGFKLPGFDIRYAGQLTTGTGQPGVVSTVFLAERAAFAQSADYLVPPSGPLTLQEAHVFTHRVYVTVPIRS